MLYNCKAGDKAVITSFTGVYKSLKWAKEKIAFLTSNVFASAMDYWNLDTNLPVFKGREID